MLQSRNDETYLAKRQRTDDALDQNGIMKMDGLNCEDDDDSPMVFKRNATVKSRQTNCSQNNASSLATQRHVSNPSLVPRDSLQTMSPSSVHKPAAQSNRTTLLKSTSSQPPKPSSVNSNSSAKKLSQSKHVSLSIGTHPNSDQRSREKVPANDEFLPLKNSLFGPDDSEDSDDSEDDKPLSFRMPMSSKGDTTKDLNKQSSSRSASNNFQLKEPVVKHFIKSEEDSDDDKPLSSKFQVKQAVKAPSDDSDDDKPLAHKFQVKQSVKTPSESSPMDSDDSEDDKPLALRCQPNGLLKDINGKTQTAKAEVGSRKRPSDDNENSTLRSSVIKKAKPLGPSTEAKVKAEPVVKREPDEFSDDEDNIPIAQRMKKPSLPTKSSPTTKKVIKVEKAKVKIEKKVAKIKEEKKFTSSPKKSKVGKLPPGSGEGQKWTTLEHHGVIFPPPYKPHGVKMLYNGKPVDLTPEQEETATMFAVMKDTDYATKPKFIENFWSDWKQVLGKNHVIQKFELCDFTPIYEWHLAEKEKKKQMSTEEKKRVKEEKLKQEEKYMWAVVDGVKEKVGNFRVEPPGLFRGRGEHPKMGKLKKRIFPEDITINIGKNAPIPECPIPGHRWKEIRHDNTVTWLAFWNDPINSKEFKYVFLAASSSLKGQSDREKYEKARMLKNYIDNIRATYTKHFKSKDPTKIQIAVATYLIDRLALRAGNEKDDDEADTVGCCTLKVENVTLLPPKSLQFDFLGKDSIRYFNTVEVDERVYNCIGQFKAGKKEGDDLFDKLDTSKLNSHLKEIMPGLTAKVFRTYNASITLDKLLQDTTGSIVPEKIADYQRANKEVAILCNHQRSVSKSHSAQMERLEGKMEELENLLKELETDLSRARKGKPPLKDAEGKPKRNMSPEMLEKKIEQTKVKIEKMKLNMRIKDDLKTVALGTSKINYLDPRISVAWCKRHEVPIEKIFNKSLLAKFAWAMDVEPDYRF